VLIINLEEIMIRLFINNFFIVRRFIALVYNFLNYPLGNYYGLIANLSKLDIWDIRLNKRVKPYNIDFGTGFNNYYGNLHALKTYSGISERLPFAHVQHGVYIDGYESTINYGIVNKVIVMNKDMKSRIEQAHPHKDVLTIGPTILYAKNYYSRLKTEEYRREFGKTMVLFLPHSVNSSKKNPNSLFNKYYNEENILNAVFQLMDGFDTLIINGFNVEEQLQFRSQYKGKRIIKTQSGSPNDFHFLSRLRTIMELADHSVSFSVSTHVGYFLSLGISHEIINIFGRNEYDVSNLNYGYTHVLINDTIPSLADFCFEASAEYKNAEIQILEAFFRTGMQITVRQMDIVRKYWGLEEIKSPNEIRHFLMGDLNLNNT
jgi:hypothetical protein